MDNVVSKRGQNAQIVPIFQTGHIWLRRSGSRAMKISSNGKSTQQENDDDDDDDDYGDDDNDDDDEWSSLSPHSSISAGLFCRNPPCWLARAAPT